MAYFNILGINIWTISEDGQHNTKRDPSVTHELEPEKDYQIFTDFRTP